MPKVPSTGHAKHRFPAQACLFLQVLLKWGLQQDMAVIPKSVQKDRIREWTAAQMEGWELSGDDMALLASMNDGRKYCWNPSDIT